MELSALLSKTRKQKDPLRSYQLVSSSFRFLTIIVQHSTICFGPYSGHKLAVHIILLVNQLLTYDNLWFLRKKFLFANYVNIKFAFPQATLLGMHFYEWKISKAAPHRLTFLREKRERKSKEKNA